jgi:hypothetical protein
VPQAEHRSNKHAYPLISSARKSSEVGSWMPIALAVLRLTMS